MSKTQLKLPKVISFHWKPKHLNHIAENIVFKKRNVSFLAINALFRQKSTHYIEQRENEHWGIFDFVPVQANDLLRTKAEKLYAIFYLDNRDNVVVITAYSENDPINE